MLLLASGKYGEACRAHALPIVLMPLPLLLEVKATRFHDQQLL